MKKIAVVLHPGQIFDNEFENVSPFINDLSYWPGMLKEQLIKIGYRLIEYNNELDTTDLCAFLHFGRYRKDIIKKYTSYKHIYLGFEPSVVNVDHSVGSLKILAEKVYDAVLCVHKGLCIRNVYELDLPVDIKYIKRWGKTDLTQLACMFSGNKYALGKELYSERRRVIEYCEKNKLAGFKFFGPNWGKPYSDYKCYGGTASDKASAAKPYKFMFCFENEYGMNGGVSEKIFDALALGKVPVYCGADDIETYVPKKCFVDYRLFSGLDACFDFLTNMSDEQYSEYIRNIESYMSDEMVKERFDARSFAETIKEICESEKRVFTRKLYVLDFCRLKQRLYRMICDLIKVIT